jgi:hypothetical protein
MDKFNNQFATQKLRQEMSVTGTGASFTPGTGEQMATNKAFKKKQKKEVKDVEPKYAAGKAKVYAKEKWGWKDAPSVPNRPSKGGFIYKQLFEELSNFVKEMDSPYEPEEQDDNEDNYDWYTDSYSNDNNYWTNKTVKIVKGTYAGNTGEVIGAGNGEVDVAVGPQRKVITVKQDEVKIVGGDNDEPVSDYGKYRQDPDYYEKDYQEKGTSDYFQRRGLDESYSKFKNETKTRGKADQFHQAVRQVRQRVQEINRLFEYVSRLKSELSEGEGGLKYKVHTEKALAKIKEMVAELNQNIKKFK